MYYVLCNTYVLFSCPAVERLLHLRMFGSKPLKKYHDSASAPKHPVSCIEPGLVTHFIYDIIHVSMPFSQIIPLRDGTGREEGSGWGTHVYLWQILFDIWQNQYNIVKLKNKIKYKKFKRIKESA